MHLLAMLNISHVKKQFICQQTSLDAVMSPSQLFVVYFYDYIFKINDKLLHLKIFSLSVLFYNINRSWIKIKWVTISTVMRISRYYLITGTNTNQSVSNALNQCKPAIEIAARFLIPHS